jgi:hypothetical protein
MVSRPAKADTSMNSVERGRWKDIDRAEAIARRDEDRSLRVERLDGAVLGRSANRRNEVVPTETIRPPLARRALRLP